MYSIINFLCGSQYKTSKTPWQLHWHPTLRFHNNKHYQLLPKPILHIFAYERIRKTPLNITIVSNIPRHNTGKKPKDVTQYLHRWILLKNLILLQPQYIKLLYYRRENTNSTQNQLHPTLGFIGRRLSILREENKYYVIKKNASIPTTPTIFLRFNKTKIPGIKNCFNTYLL